LLSSIWRERVRKRWQTEECMSRSRRKGEEKKEARKKWEEKNDAGEEDRCRRRAAPRSP
jgi:hypothetical protein